MLEGKSDEAVDGTGSLAGENSKGAGEEAIAILRDRMVKSIGIEIEPAMEIERDRHDKYRSLWLQFLRRIWALGPRQVGPNVCFVPDIKREYANKPMEGSTVIRGSPFVSERLGFLCSADNSNEGENISAENSDREDQPLHMETESLASSVVAGFQLATSAGPLCDEPMWGLTFLIEACIHPLHDHSEDSSSYESGHQYGVLTGQVMYAVKEACRQAVLQKKPRLVEAMHFCELNTPTEYLGPMYAVLARRQARVLKEEMQKGSSLFTVHAYVPVSESFGFADELRWTAGASSALLLFSHWEALPQDPFFIPKTEEEIEEFGDGSSVPQNTARKLIDAVRRRKGLPVEEKVVQHATKQRTLARKV